MLKMLNQYPLPIIKNHRIVITLKLLKIKTMYISVIQIGNSKGIRLPKTLIDKNIITDAVELILEKDHIILKPKIGPRKNWEQAFEEMHQNGDDQLPIPDVFEDENIEEWS